MDWIMRKLNNGESQNPFPVDKIPRVGLPVEHLKCKFCNGGIVYWMKKNPNEFFCAACLSLYGGPYPAGSKELLIRKLPQESRLWRNA
jgi:hypothetical protein